MAAGSIKRNVVSVIFCDDIREEKGGKHTLVGVYNDAAVFGSFPAGFLQLAVRIVVNQKKYREKAVVKIFVGGAEMGNQTFPIAGMQANQPLVLTTKLRLIQFDKPTKLEIALGFDDVVPEVVGALEMREPQTDREVRDLKSIA